MKELRDPKDLTIHDVQPISDEQGEGLPHLFLFDEKPAAELLHGVENLY